jgi:hypothetical protein
MTKLSKTLFARRAERPSTQSSTGVEGAPSLKLHSNRRLGKIIVDAAAECR